MTAGGRIPWLVRAPVRRARNAIGRVQTARRERPRWREIARTPPRAEGLAVSYGVDGMPALDEVVAGGRVKFALLAEELPNSPRDFNILYLGSSSLPPDAWMLARLARRRGVPFVWNQDGVAYPGWHGPGWELVNRPLARLLHASDYVIFQSEFCRLSADRFLGRRAGPGEVLHNPVDIRRFTPGRAPARRPLTLLLAGNQYQRYRLETALETLALLRPERADAVLLVAGELSFARDAPSQASALVERLGLEDAVEFVGPYTQRAAPELMRSADVLLHTKYNDPCPTVVLEAMACGLPIVYSASGGVPELVGGEAGAGVPAPLDWEREHPPSAAALASCVLDVVERLAERAEAARRRAVERFDARLWILRHRELFASLRGAA